MSFDIATTYYDPKARPANEGDKKEFELLPEDKHVAIIHKVTRKFEDKEINSRDKPGIKHLADLIEVTYKIHDQNGHGFAGRLIWSSAIWVWKDAKHIATLGMDNSTVQPNDGGNERYAKFLEVAGYKLIKKTIELEDANGKSTTRDVWELPIDIDLDDALGKVVTIKVVNRKYTDKNGTEKTAQNEMGLYANTQVKEDDDLPF